MEGSWETCGPDTIHATFKEGPTRNPAELAALLQEFQLGYDLPTAAVVRDRGVSGFAAAAVDKAAGLRLDWTRPDDEGANKGYFCLQVKGEWFDKADLEVTADFLQLLEAYGIYRITRIDIQQTHKTKKYLTPWWIKGFETGNLKVIGKKYFEPRGRKSSSDDYPAGATVYHGSRTSERFARQYDRHKKQDYGPPRRRDEIELKGDTSRALWSELMTSLSEAEQIGEERGVRLRSFSKSAIRAYLPIRDTSRWINQDLPQNWAAMASEPTTWANLFQEEAQTIQPAPPRVTSLLKSYRYSTSNFGAAVGAVAVSRYHELLDDGYPTWEAMEQVSIGIIDDFVLGANEDRVMEFLDDVKPSQKSEFRDTWLMLLRNAANNADNSREDKPFTV